MRVAASEIALGYFQETGFFPLAKRTPYKAIGEEVPSKFEMPGYSSSVAAFQIMVQPLGHEKGCHCSVRFDGVVIGDVAGGRALKRIYVVRARCQDLVMLFPTKCSNRSFKY